LPNGATRSPDISWVRNERLERLSEEQWEKFLPLCPDFVLELRSTSDSLRVLKEKLEEYIDNGAQLGWLIDPDDERAYIYRPNKTPQMLDKARQISGEPVLRGFILDFAQVWRTMKRRDVHRVEPRSKPLVPLNA